MKTGFICASGFNVVATATRNGRKLIVVVFGSRSGMVRSEKAAQLFEKGFNSGGLSWLMPSLGTVDALQPIAAAPPNLRDEMCGKHRKRPAAGGRRRRDRAGEQRRRPELGLCGDDAEPARPRGDAARCSARYGVSCRIPVYVGPPQPAMPATTQIAAQAPAKKRRPQRRDRDGRRAEAGAKPSPRP